MKEETLKNEIVEMLGEIKDKKAIYAIFNIVMKYFLRE